MIDDYHDNLIRHSLSILGCNAMRSKKFVKNEKVVENKSVSLNEKKPTDKIPQYFYDISTNLFIPPSL